MLEAKAADPSLEACIPDSETCGRQAKVSSRKARNAEAASSE